MRTRVALAAISVLLLTVTSCGSEDSGSGDVSSGPSVSPTGDDKQAAESEVTGDAKLTRQGVEDHETWGPGAFVFHYEIKNSGDEAADYFVGVEFLDGDGDVLGSTGVGAEKLGPGKSKQANSSPLTAEIENGEMSDIEKARISEVVRTPVK